MTILQETENCSSRQNEGVEAQEESKNSNNKNNTDSVKKSSATSTSASSKDLSTRGQAQDENVNTDFDDENCIVRPSLRKEIAKQVLRKKLAKLRHLVLSEAISPAYLDSLFPDLLKYFDPQKVTYNGGIANIKEWKISCYLEVMEGGVPTANPNMELLNLFHPLLDECNNLFLYWYRQKSACNSKLSSPAKKEIKCSRLMTFITRYTPAPGEQALLKHVDGSGKVDGSIVVALPIDRWSAPESTNSFVGHGGGLTFWDGRNRETKSPNEIHYETRSGDLAFIDRAVWHQADPITKGTRWALVIFYKVEEEAC